MSRSIVSPPENNKECAQSYWSCIVSDIIAFQQRTGCIIKYGVVRKFSRVLRAFVIHIIQ